MGGVVRIVSYLLFYFLFADAVFAASYVVRTTKILNYNVESSLVSSGGRWDFSFSGIRSGQGLPPACAGVSPLPGYPIRWVYWLENARVISANGSVRPVYFSQNNSDFSVNGRIQLYKELFDGNRSIMVITDASIPLATDGNCVSAGESSFTISVKNTQLSNALVAGVNTLEFEFRTLRIISTDTSISYLASLANSFKGSSVASVISMNTTIRPYCVRKDTSDVFLAHGAFAAGTGNGKEASATVEYECNLETSKPQIKFTGAGVISGNQVKICDGLFSVLSATTDNTQGYNFKTVFKSTLSGNASSSCVGAFSKNVVAVISPP